MGEMILNSAFRHAGIDAVADSAGLGFVEEGSRILTQARTALEFAGIPAYPHSARRVTAQMLGGYQLILAMTERQADSLRERYGSVCDVEAIHMWREFEPQPAGRAPSASALNVNDPWSTPGLSTHDTVTQLLSSVDGIIDWVVSWKG